MIKTEVNDRNIKHLDIVAVSQLANKKEVAQIASVRAGRKRSSAMWVGFFLIYLQLHFLIYKCNNFDRY